MGGCVQKISLLQNEVSLTTLNLSWDTFSVTMWIPYAEGTFVFRLVILTFLVYSTSSYFACQYLPYHHCLLFHQLVNVHELLGWYPLIGLSLPSSDRRGWFGDWSYYILRGGKCSNKLINYSTSECLFIYLYVYGYMYIRYLCPNHWACPNICMSSTQHQGWLWTRWYWPSGYWKPPLLKRNGCARLVILFDPHVFILPVHAFGTPTLTSNINSCRPEFTTNLYWWIPQSKVTDLNIIHD